MQKKPQRKKSYPRKKQFVPPKAELAKREVDLTKPLLDVDDICGLLKCSRSAVFANVANGHFPEGVIVGQRQRRWKTADVLSHIASL